MPGATFTFTGNGVAGPWLAAELFFDRQSPHCGIEPDTMRDFLLLLMLLSATVGRCRAGSGARLRTYPNCICSDRAAEPTTIRRHLGPHSRRNLPSGFIITAERNFKSAIRQASPPPRQCQATRSQFHTGAVTCLVLYA